MRLRNLALASLLVAVAPASLVAQQVRLTPLVGVHAAAGDYEGLQNRADAVWTDKEGALALGLNAEIGFLRGSVGYVGDAVLTRGGVEGDVIGEGSLLVAAGDIVLRPIPRLVIFQPYVLGGIGLKRRSYSYDSEELQDLPDEETDTAFHLGGGLDLMMGSLGVVFEVSDYITRSDEDGFDFGRHDAFASIGIALSL